MRDTREKGRGIKEGGEDNVSEKKKKKLFPRNECQ